MKRKEMLTAIGRWIKFFKRKSREPEIYQIDPGTPRNFDPTVHGLLSLVLLDEQGGIFKEIIQRIAEAAVVGRSNLVITLEGSDLNDEAAQYDFFDRLVEKLPKLIREIYVNPAVKVPDKKRYRLTFALTWKLKNGASLA